MYNKLLGALALLFLAAGASQAADLLMYEPSMDDCNGTKGPIPCNEIEVAQADGHSLTIVDESGWAGMSAGQFAAFDALIFGDGACGGGEAVFGAVNANKTTWSPVVTGNIVVHTFDPFAHETDPNDTTGTIGLTSNGMNVAASGEGTGLYYANGCRNDNVPSPAKGGSFELVFLSAFGSFVLGDDNQDPVTIVDPSSPVVAGLTEADLSDWGESTHAFFISIPPEFMVVATSVPGAGDKGTLQEVPVLITRGTRFVGTIPTLSPVGLGLLGLLIAGLGTLVVRRRRS